MDNRSKRERAAERVRALLAMTVENGCTEAEAVSAARKAAELMDAAGLTIEELRSAGKSDWERRDHPTSDPVGWRLWKVAEAIALLTDTKTWGDGAGAAATRQTFFGLTHDVRIAVYLLEICERAMRTEAKTFERGLTLYRKEVRRSRSLAFLDGMSDRLASRIREINRSRASRASGDGRAVVLVKSDMLVQALHEAGVDLRNSAARQGRKGMEGYLEGRAAADRVRLDPGLEAQAKAAIGEE